MAKHANKAVQAMQIFENSNAICCEKLGQAVSCKICNEKYHLMCIEMTVVRLKREEAYVCYDCKKKDEMEKVSSVQVVNGQEKIGDKNTDVATCLQVFMSQLSSQ